MSQPELVARLRAARPVAPEELRERVLLLAERAAPPPRRFRWRRATLVLVPAAMAAVLAVAVLPRGETPQQAAVTMPAFEQTTADTATDGVRATAPPVAGATEAAPKTANAPAPAPGRAQRYSAFLELRVADADAVSSATQRALTVVSSLGGYPVSVEVDTSEAGGTAQLLLRVPRENVQDAVRRLGALGTIVDADFSIQDIQAGVDETARTIERLEARRATLRAQPATPELQQRIASLTARINRLRTAQAEALRAAALATIELNVATPSTPVAEDDDGPLSGLGTVFRWAGIAAVYVLALAAPLAVVAALVWFAAKHFRRRRDERLLSAS